jgi:hypothetical protein
MKLYSALSLTALLSFPLPAQAELKCKCDHMPIEPKRCVDRCFGALLNNLSSKQMVSILGLGPDVSHDIVAIRDAKPIESIASLQSQLSADSFERLKSRIDAAAAGQIPEPQALGEQLAVLRLPSGDTTDSPSSGSYSGSSGSPNDQIAMGVGETTASSRLPRTASIEPLLGIFGAISLLSSLVLWSYRKRSAR